MPLLRSPSGAIVSLPAEEADQAEAGGFAPVDITEAGATAAQPAPEDRGVLGGINAAATGLLSGATLGLSDYALRGVLDQGQFARLAAEREGHPIASTAGQIAGAVIPTLGTFGGSAIASAPAGILGRAATGIADAGRAIGGVEGAGRVLLAGGIEGAAQNAGMYLADTALGDRELSAEGMAAELGMGFGFGVGGGAAALGIEKGTIAVRRMFSRAMDGGERAALDAEHAWRAHYQSTIEANNAAADIARAKLAEAQQARQQAGLVRDRAGAAVAEAKARAPVVDTARADAAAFDERASKIGALEQGAPGPAVAPPGGIDWGALDRVNAMSPVEEQAQRYQTLSAAQEQELATAVTEHDTALAELEQVLTRLETPEIEADQAVEGLAVPVGEFGAPGTRGYDPGHVKAPGPPSAVEARTGDVTAIGRKRFGQGTPTDAQVLPQAGKPEPVTGERAVARRAKPVSSDEFKAWQSDYAKQLSKQEDQDLDTYTSSTYRDLNKYLRHGSVRHGREKILANIDSALSKSSLPRDTIVYRGLSGEESKAFRAMEPGDSFVEKSYSSTSASPTAFKRDVNLHIEVPAGYEAAPIPSRMSNANTAGDIESESEILLRRNTKYLVTGVEDDGAARTIHVRVVPSDEPMSSLESMVSGETRRLPDTTPPVITKRSPTPAASDLEGQLRAMQDQLGAGRGLNELGAPARAEYAANKAAKTTEAADHFRAQAIAAHDVPDYAALSKHLDSKGVDYLEQTIPASKIAERGYYEPPGGHTDPVRMDNARAVFAPGGVGQYDPIKLTVSKTGKIGVTDGRHRLAAAIEANAPIRVKWATGSEPAEWEVLRGGTPTGGQRSETFMVGGKDLKLTTETASMPGGKAKTTVTVLRTLSDGEEVTAASAEFVHRESGLYPDHVNVEPALRRNGIASKMYDAAEKASGKPILPSETQTAEGKAFRSARDARARPAVAGRGDVPVGHDAFFANLTRPKTRDAYVAANIGRAMREEGSHDAALAKVEREWSSMGPTVTQLDPGVMRSAVHDVADAAERVTTYEKAVTRLVEALGPEAPPIAQEAAKAFRAAEDNAERKTMDRATRAIDDHAEAQAKRTDVVVTRRTGGAHAPREKYPGESDSTLFVTPDGRSVPRSAAAAAPTSKQAIASAKQARLEADAAFKGARVRETEAKIGAQDADRLAADTRAAADAARPTATAGVAPSSSRLGTIATAIGVAGELGVPGIPKPHDIPVIGTLLSTYLKYRALKATVGRFVGRVPASGEARAAALVAKTKERIAVAVDRTLGLAAELAPKARGAIVATTTALARRAFDDGEPDAPKGANAQQLAAVRIREIATAATRPELVASLVRREMSAVADPDLIAAAEQHLQARFVTLNDMMPKAPPPNPYSRREWVPSAAAASEVAQRLAVVHDPESAFVDPTLVKVDTVRAVFPKLLEIARQRLIARVSDVETPVPYQQRLRGSLLFGVQLDDSLDPQAIATFQSAHVKDAGNAVPQPSAAPTPSIANATNLTALYQPGSDRRAMQR